MAVSRELMLYKPTLEDLEELAKYDDGISILDLSKAFKTPEFKDSDQLFRGFCAIADILRNNLIQRLILDHNLINYPCAYILAAALKENNSINQLSLKNCDFAGKSQGLKLILDTVCTKPSVEKIYLSQAASAEAAWELMDKYEKYWEKFQFDKKAQQIFYDLRVNAVLHPEIERKQSGISEHKIVNRHTHFSKQTTVLPPIQRVTIPYKKSP